MAAASRDKLADLHDLLTDKMIEALASGEVSPATFSAVAKFLKDNGIESVAVPGGKLEKLRDRLKVLPFPTTATGTDA